MCRYECHNCGRRFEEPDIITETHGLESPPYEKFAVCPYCRGWFDEMYQCEICGEWFADDELTSGVCDGCIYEDVTVDRCLRYGEDCEEKIAINGFVAYFLGVETIKRVLAREVENAMQIIPFNFNEFVDSDKSWWAEKRIEDKEKKNDNF